jgi:hypothetical protein
MSLTRTILAAALSAGFLFPYQRNRSTEGSVRYKYDTPGTKLQGTLVKRKVYGPPGYGETPAKDAKETILILKLPHAIDVQPAANAEANRSVNLDPAMNILEVQLIPSRSRPLDSDELVGKSVTTTGTLNESVTASQRTKVWMDLQSIDPN